MKKFITTVILASVSGLAVAADFASLEVDRVRDTKTRAESNAQYLRAGKDVAGLQLGLQARTQVWHQGGMVNSLEGTVGKQVGAVNVFGGVGYDNGYNGAKNGNFEYGVVGASTGMKLGSVYAFGGAKTRVNWESANPKQTLAFAGVNVPLNKTFSVDVSASKSYQDIQERAAGLALRVAF